jgi:hypothetical protein
MTIFEPVVHLAQTVTYLALTLHIVSKWTEMRFRLSLVTSDYHQVRPE